MTAPANKDSSIVYLDVDLSPGSFGITPLAKVVSRSGNILNSVSDYKCAVIRAVIPISSVSVYMWQPAFNLSGTASANGYNTIYSITLKYGAFTSTTVYLQSIQTDLTVSIPSLPLRTQPNNKWGAVYDYQTIVDMLNVALSSAYASLLLQVPTLNANPPYYSFDTTTAIFSLQGSTPAQYDQNQLGSPDVVKIYFNNESLTPFLVGWPIIRTSMASNNPSSNLLIVKNLGTATTWLISQQFSAFWAFTALTSIQIISTIPTIPEFMDLPTSQTGYSPNNQTTSVLCDFEPDYTETNSGGWNAPLIYSANSVIPGARFCQMVGNNALTEFSIAVTWTDSYNNSYPVLVSSPNQNASLKIVFAKKRILDPMAELPAILNRTHLSPSTVTNFRV